MPIYAKPGRGRDSLLHILMASIARPTKMLLTEPVVILFTLWVAFAWGILFLFLSSVAQTFSTDYRSNTF
jgi:hypothetical protein